MRKADFANFKLKYHLHNEIDGTKRGHTSIHLDYERGEWFYDQLVIWLKKHIPRYALSPKELDNIQPEELFSKVEKAARMIYGRKAKTGRRGEIGELILHGLVTDLYKTSPVISKIFRKSARSDTVKGFDCVHVIIENSEVESLWLGEAKFYKSISAAMKSASESIIDMQNSLKLKDEFMLIGNDIDTSNEVGEKVASLLNESTSLDEITPKICIPVLLAYESPTVGKHSAISQAFLDDIDKEVTTHVEDFKKLIGTVDVDIHIFIFSMTNKKEVVSRFDTMLKGHQSE